MKLTKHFLYEAACNVSDRAAQWPNHHSYSCSAVILAVNAPYALTDDVLSEYAHISAKSGVHQCVPGNGYVPVTAFSKTPRGRERTYKEANELRFTYLLLLAASS